MTHAWPGVMNILENKTINLKKLTPSEAREQGRHSPSYYNILYCVIGRGNQRRVLWKFRARIKRVVQGRGPRKGKGQLGWVFQTEGTAYAKVQRQDNMAESRSLKSKELVYLYMQVDSCIIIEIKNLREHTFEIVKQDSCTYCLLFVWTQTLSIASNLRKVTVAFKIG